MANSSEWPGGLAALAQTAAMQPAWLELVAPPGAFRETLPFPAARSVAAPPQKPAHEAEREPPPPPAPSIEAALAAARAEGEAAGRAAALAEAAAGAARQRALRLAFRALDEAALTALADDLAETVIALCDGVLGRHAADRAALLERCHAAAARIGAAAGALRLHLHPDDLATLDPEALAGWKLVCDETLEPGALLLESPEGALRDGPADWRRAIAEAVRG